MNSTDNLPASIEELKQELSLLNSSEQRHLTVFLVALLDGGDTTHRKKFPTTIDTPAVEPALLPALDRRWELPDDCSRN